MARSAFFNDNLYRNYPFQTDELGQSSGINALPVGILLDAKIYTGSNVYFDSDPQLYLSAVSVSGGTASLTFTATDGTITETLVFSVSSSAEKFDVVYAGIGSSNPTISGYIVVGDFTEIWALGGPVSGVVNLEPTRLVQLQSHGLRSISFGNANRRRFDAPTYCEPFPWEGLDPSEIDYWNQPDYITSGVVVLKEGFNCRLFANPVSNTIQIQPSSGGGAGVVSTMYPLGTNGVGGQAEPLPYGEDDPIYTKYNGVQVHSGVVRSVQGAEGYRLAFAAGLGISITYDPDNYKIIIDTTLTGLTECVEAS